MRILIAYESSGTVRNAFRALGADAVSCDLLPTDDASGPHIQGDIRDVIARGDKWDLIIAHPPCTYLCSSGLHWNKRVEGRAALTEAALDDVRWLMSLYHNGVTKALAIENPIGCISSQIMKPSQIIQPWMFGEDASKQTCLWLFNLPNLEWSDESAYPPRIVNGKKRWGNQTDSGQNRLGPSPDRWKLRSKTYDGIAQAMASQWLNHLTNK